jgi:DNA-binding LacI/PurR family transcriptional regulator
MQVPQGLGKRSAAVLEALRQDLDADVFPPGSRLPTEDQLMARFEVGRNTVRRAVARLAAEGRLVTRRRAGTFAREARTPEAPASRTIAAMFSLDRTEYIDIQNHALGRGYALCVYSRMRTGYDPAPERAWLECARRDRFRGILACCTPTPPQNDLYLDEMAQEGVRVIHLEPCRTEPPVGNFILADYRRGGYMAAVSLMLAGYRRLIYVGMEEDWPAAALVKDGFADALRDHRGGYDPAQHGFIFPGGIPADRTKCEEVRAFLRTLLPATGLMCREPLLARLLLDLAREQGLDTPRDLGVISVRYFDDWIDPGGIDMVEFERLETLKRAIDWVTRPAMKRMQTWLPPRIVRHGSARAPKPSAGEPGVPDGA